MATLSDRLAALEQQQAQTQQLRERAVSAANAAGLDLVRLEAQIALVKELIAEQEPHLSG